MENTSAGSRHSDEAACGSTGEPVTWQQWPCRPVVVAQDCLGNAGYATPYANEEACGAARYGSNDYSLEEAGTSEGLTS